MLFLRLPWSEVVPPHLHRYSLPQNPLYSLLRIYLKLWPHFPCCSFPLRCKFQRDKPYVFLFHQNISKIQQGAGHIIGTYKEYWIENVSLTRISDHVFFIFYLPQNISLQMSSWADCIDFLGSLLQTALPFPNRLFWSHFLSPKIFSSPSPSMPYSPTLNMLSLLDLCTAYGELHL